MPRYETLARYEIGGRHYVMVAVPPPNLGFFGRLRVACSAAASAFVGALR